MRNILENRILDLIENEGLDIYTMLRDLLSFMSIDQLKLVVDNYQQLTEHENGE